MLVQWGGIFNVGQSLGLPRWSYHSKSSRWENDYCIDVLLKLVEKT